MAHILKTNNYHKAHHTECDRCGRRLPKKAYRPVCSTCIKHQKLLAETTDQWRTKFHIGEQAA